MTTRRFALRERDQFVGMFISCVGAATFLTCFLPGVLHGTLALVLLAGAILASLFTVVFHVRQGGSVAGALVLLLLWGSVTAGTLYGTWWYFMVHLMAQSDPFGVQTLTHATPSHMASPLHAPSSPTITPSPNVSSMTGFRVCGTGTVHGVDALALRVQPNRDAPQILAVLRGAIVEVSCTASVQADERTWQHVRSGTIEGWMSTRYLHIEQR